MIFTISLTRRGICNVGRKARRETWDPQLKANMRAQSNTLPLHIFRKMFHHLVNDQGKPVELIAVSGRSARLTAYNNHDNTSIACYGTTYIQCKYGESEWFDTKFFLVGVEGPAVVGLPSSVKLKLVTMHCNTVDVNKS